MNKKITVSDDELTDEAKRKFLDEAFHSIGEAMEGIQNFLMEPTEEDPESSMKFRSVKFQIEIDNEPTRVQIGRAHV